MDRAGGCIEGPEDAACLIFDWDGTLVDTYTANYRSLSRALAQRGVVLPEEWYLQHTGKSVRDVIAMLLGERDSDLQASIDAVVANRNSIFLQSLDTIKEFTPVASIARRFRGRSKLAIASGGSRPIIDAALRSTGLNHIFNLVVTREEVRAGKPAPDLFLLAASRLEVPPSSCLVYEDSDDGLLAARRAGMATIDVRPWRDRVSEHDGAYDEN